MTADADWTPEEEARRLAMRFEHIKNKSAFARDFEIPGGVSMLGQHCRGTRPISWKAAVAYARGFGISLAEISPRLARETALIDEAAQRRAPTTLLTRDSGATLAEVMSLYKNTVSSPPYMWEEMMKWEELPAEPFLALLWDDAMAPELPAGRRVEFSAREEPIFGDKVLIRWDDKLHFRSYRQSDDGRSWVGHATHADYANLHPERGAKVVAVMTAHVVPRGVRWSAA